MIENLIEYSTLELIGEEVFSKEVGVIFKGEVIFNGEKITTDSRGSTIWNHSPIREILEYFQVGVSKTPILVKRKKNAI